MSTKDDGGPAFPVPPGNVGPNGEVCTPCAYGMFLRDWFAGMAQIGDLTVWLDKGYTYQQARWLHADEMLVERNKP